MGEGGRGTEVPSWGLRFLAGGREGLFVRLRAASTARTRRPLWRLAQDDDRATGCTLEKRSVRHARKAAKPMRDSSLRGRASRCCGTRERTRPASLRMTPGESERGSWRHKTPTLAAQGWAT